MRAVLSHRTGRLLALAVLAAAAVPALAAPGAGSAPAADDRPQAIISLGDSFISGEAGRWQGNVDREYQVREDMYGTDRAAYGCDAQGKNCSKDPKRVYGNSYENPDALRDEKKRYAGCHRSDVAEIQRARWPATRGTVKKINIACSGAEAHHIITRKYKGEDPQKYQLTDWAAKYNIKAIHLSIGGNDLKFSKIITDCAEGFANPIKVGPCNGKWRQTVREALGEDGYVRKNVRNALQAIINAMGKKTLNADYIIVLQSYPSPIPAPADFRYAEGLPPLSSQRWAPGGCPFYNVDAAWARNEVIQELSNALQAVANEKDVDFLDLRNAFDHHTLCRTGTHQATMAHTLDHPLPDKDAEWIRFISQTIVKRAQGQVEESIHPTADGQAALGVCLTKLYEAKDKARGHRRYTCEDQSQKGVNDMTLTARP
ncbi:hypothetical protein ADK43_08970 [Streptomyces rimosus subsp. rimosus]|nr:hypothetical protein ADK43_08970 [Streptomyces rimosus subsp. rimosus]